jgi:predicted metal-dependent HD superfamily phosphohydrolase
MFILRDQWQSTWQKLSLPAAGDQTFDDICHRYREPHRKYHTVQHLEECFAKLQELQFEAMRIGEVELALWFHDAVYDVFRHDNEEKSAELACSRLQQVRASGEIINRVRGLIMATRHHEPEGVDAQVLVDVDLSILGESPSRFQEYEQQIRGEYRHVPSLLFTHKRKKVLEGFLRRDRIFKTDVFFERYEKQARENLVGSLQS